MMTNNNYGDDGGLSGYTGLRVHIGVWRARAAVLSISEGDLFYDDLCERISEPFIKRSKDH